MGTQMKATGEVMTIDRSFEESKLEFIHLYAKGLPKDAKRSGIMEDATTTNFSIRREDMHMSFKANPRAEAQILFEPCVNPRG